MQSQPSEEHVEPWVRIHTLVEGILTEHMQGLLSRGRQRSSSFTNGFCTFNIQAIPPGVYATPKVYRQFSSINLERLVTFLTSMRNQIRPDAYIVFLTGICRDTPRDTPPFYVRDKAVIITDGGADSFEINLTDQQLRAILGRMREFEQSLFISAVDARRGLYHVVAALMMPSVSRLTFIVPKPPIKLPWGRLNLALMLILGISSLWFLATHPGADPLAASLSAVPFLIAVFYPWLKPFLRNLGIRTRWLGKGKREVTIPVD